MKKIGILFLSLVTVFLTLLTLVPSVFAADESYSFEINVYKESGKSKLPQPAASFGQVYQLNVDGLASDGDFAFIVHDGNIIEDALYNITVSDSTVIDVVVRDEESTVGLYVDTNGRLLHVSFDETPSYDGATPSKPGFTFAGWSSPSITVYGDAKYVAQYTLANDTEFDVVIHGGEVDLAVFKYNDVVTLTPDNEEEFSYWADVDGQVVSTNPNYKFSVLADVELTAVYEENYEPQFSVYLQNVTGIRENYESFLAYINNPDPIRFKIIEYGLLASEEAKVLFLDDEGVEKSASGSLVPTTNEFLKSIEEGAFASKRAYVIYTDNGVQKVVYSDNNFATITNYEQVISNTAIASYSGETTGNMIAGNNAEAIGLNPELFTVTSIQRNVNPLHIGLNKDGQIRLYGSTDGLGNILTIAVANGHVITKVKFNFGSSIASLKATFGETVDMFTPNSNTSKEYTQLSVSSFSLQNVNTNTNQVYILSVEITYDRIEILPTIDTQLYQVSLHDGENINNLSVMKNKAINTLENPTKVGYTFINWLDENNQPFSLSSPINRHIVLTANYTINTWNISFDTNGGTPITPQLDVEYGTEIQKPEDPTKVGYTFAGWYLDEELTVSVEWPFIVPDIDSILYADWTPNKYTIITAGEGGSEINDIEAGFGSLVEKPEDPERDGYNFVAWYLDEELTEEVEWPIVMPLGDMTIYAKWVDASVTYTVSFELHGGNDSIEDIVVSAGEKITKPTDPSKDGGFIFKGWYAESDYINEFDFDTPITADITLHAKWVAIYTVTFDSNGGSAVTTIENVEYGTTVTKPADPTKDGFDFVGWFLSLDNETSFDFNTPITTDLILYAKWEEKTITVTPITVMAKSPNTSKNMVEGINYANAFGLDESIFSVTAIKGAPSNIIGLYSDFRIYGNKTDGNGNSLVISIALGYKITAISYEFGGSTNSATASVTVDNLSPILLNSSEVSNKTQTFNDIFATSVTIKNSHITNGSVGQVRINLITITYIPE